MKTILRLLRLQIDNKVDILKTATPKKMIIAILKVILVSIILTVALGMALERVFILGFKINAELITLVLFVTQLVSFAFALGTVINTLYLCKDNEMLVCLPVTPNQLFISKILMVYITEFVVNAFISIPLFLSLGSLTYTGFPISYYCSIPLMLIMMPILPIILASLLSVPIMKVINFLKKHTILSLVSIFSFIAACLWSYLLLISKIASTFNINEDKFAMVARIDGLIAKLGSNIPIYYQLSKGMLDFSRWYYFAIFMAILFALSALTFLITRYYFFKIAMSSLEKSVKKKVKNHKFRKHNQFISLLIKEFKCIFRSTSDVFEYFLFTFLMPFIVFSYDKLLVEINVRQAGKNMIAGAHVMVVAILAMLSNISSASAISRDGGNFYTSKIIPVNFYTQISAKFVFNFIFTFIAIVITGLISMLYYPAWQVLLSSLAVVMASIGHIAYCIDTDIKYPTPNVQGDEVSSTVSKTTPKALIYGLLIGFILGIIVMLMSEMKNQLIPYFLIIGLSMIFMIYRVYTLILRIELAYDKIEM